MSDSRSATSTAPTGDGLLDAAEAIGATLVRVGVAAVSLPLYVLPPNARADARDAASDLFTAVGELHLSLLKAAVEGLGILTRGLATTTQPASPATTKVAIETTPSTPRKS